MTPPLSGRAGIVGGPHLMILPLKSGPCSTEHRADIPPHNELCQNWSARSVEVRRGGDGVEIVVDGAHTEAEGCYTMRLDRGGQITIGYRFSAKREVNPRQVGVVLELPKQFTTLSWERDADWSIYPPDHIGRPRGTAYARRASRWLPVDDRTPPPWPWALDENQLGTNDFRATRRNIRWAALWSDPRTSIFVHSDGTQSARAWIDGDHVRLLVAGFDTGGADMFLASHYASERRPLKPGDEITDEVRLELRTSQPRGSR